MTAPTETPLRGLPLLNIVMQLLIEHPELHDQELYLHRNNLRIEDPLDPKCGTTGCIAGWTVVLAGEQIDWRGGVQSAMRTIEGHSIESVAQDMLGLTYPEAEALFAEGNDWDDILEIVERIRSARR